jgi:hypothetical protein
MSEDLRFWRGLVVAFLLEGGVVMVGYLIWRVMQ